MFEIMLTAVMALSLWFLLPLAGLSLFCLLLLWNEEGTGASVVLAVLFGVIVYITPGLLDFIILNPFNILVTLASYVFIGLFWSFFKWFRLLLKIKASYVKNGTKVTTLPSASDYSNYIIFWIAYWPISVLRYFLGDFLEEIITRFSKIFGSVYQRISGFVFRDIRAE